jgi:hypothetical protein
MRGPQGGNVVAGTWTDLNQQPGVNIDTMLLLTDGRVLCHEFQSKNWHTLTPPDSGDYRDGHWDSVEALPDNANIPTSFGGPTNAPTFFASAVLADGRVFVAGGEYNSTQSTSNDSLTAQIYDPRTDHWTAISTPTGWTGIGDAVSCVLPDGRLMLGQYNGSAVAIYDPDLDLWTFTSAKGDSCSEETFTLMPDGTVVTVQCSNANNAEKYVIATDQWVSAGTTPSTLPQACPGFVAEIGPAILLPSGTLFAVGATGNTALYDPTQPVASAWTAGPTLTDSANNTSFPMDAPGVLLPNGKVLLAGSPAPACSYPGPTTFFEYNPSTNKAAVVSSPTDASTAVFTTRFLLLPTGEVLYSNDTSRISIYKPDGSPKAAWKPTITSAPTDMVLGHTYVVSGTQLNGLSQACSYGDDAQMATNYPLVRLTRTATGTVRYLPTAHHSTMGVATGSTICTTNVTVPMDVPPGQHSLVVVANGIASDPVDVHLVSRDCFLIVDRSTYGQGEIQAMINNAGAPATIDPAVYVVVEGFTPNELGLTSANLANPPHKPSIPDPVAGVSFEFSGAVVPENPALPNSPQRFTFPMRVKFQDASMFNFASSTETLPIHATVAASGSTVTAAGAIELIKNPNPFILHGDIAHGYPWYVSIDIRVFQLKAGERRFAAQVASTGDPHDAALNFVTQAITNLNGSPASAGAMFDALPEGEDQAALALSPVDSSGTPVYNFAVARVRYRDTSVAQNVRLFFRMWPAQQTNAIFDTGHEYRTLTNTSGQKIPGLGIRGDEIVTIPFFATRRVDTSTVSMKTQTDEPNRRLTVNPDPLGGEIDLFYGCWLDINQPGDLLFPARMVGGIPANLPDGPFVNMGTLHSIQQLVRSQHQCLIAEIAFDPDVIPPGADPSISDKLAQRNLTFVNVPNPGVLATRRAPQTFEVRPTPPGRPVGFPHDELMIEWGDVPAGSTASIYLPATGAADILTIADRTYTSHRLTALDANTIGCAAEGVTYVPIPPGQQAEHFAGLLTVDLPAGIRQGERYDVTVKQVTVVPVLQRDVRDDGAHVGAVAENGKTAFGTGWRRVLGVFTMTITVGTKHRLLAGEERLLSILRWIELSIPVESRWYLVFRRYVDQIAHRVRFMGGDPTAIGPTPDGDWQHLRPGEHGERGHGADGERRLAFEGKVRSLIYDRYGDFAGFVLDTEDGERRFHSTERPIEHVVWRAWEHRIRTTVIVEVDDEHRPETIVLSGLYANDD